MERYKESTSKHTPHTDISDIMTDVKNQSDLTQKHINNCVSEPLVVDAILDGAKQCSMLAPTHPVAKYLAGRLIPKYKWHLIYYTTRIKKYTNKIVPGTFSNLDNDHPRLLFPYFDIHGKVYAFSARAFKDEQPKYFTIKIDKDAERIYGLERVDYAKRIYAFEGQIDSLFIPNGIAVSGSSFESPTIEALKTNLTVVIDREPRNKDIVRILHTCIKRGYSVAMLPDTMPGKDINQYVENGMSVGDILAAIDTHTFSGPTAELEFINWKKI